MLDSDSLIPHNIINQLFISGSILPYNQDDLIDINTRLDNGDSQFEVRQYHFKPTGLDMAVKRLQLPRKRKNNKTKIKTDKLIKEAKILSQIKHSNDIIEFYGLCFDRDYALLCIELMDMNLSELNGIIRKIESGCLYNMLPHIVVPIIDGLEYCHKNNIIHRDIKPNNILFNRSGNFKIGDFSESHVMDSTNTENFNGTILYWSPERVRNTEIKDPKYDIWGLGMTLLEIIIGFHPYENLLGLNPDVIILMQLIENIDPETLLQCAIQTMDEYNKYIMNYTKDHDDELKLISRCLKRIDERATIDELKNTPYYKIVQKECRRNESLMKKIFGRYEQMNKTLYEENFRKLDTLIFEENSRRYNLSYSKLKFRLPYYPKVRREIENAPRREMNICYHANADKWIILKNYFKDPINIISMIDELTFLHKFAGQPFIPQFYGWRSIEHNKSYRISSYSICFEVMDMNLREFYSKFINNFGYEAFNYSLSEEILGYISCVVLNALLEIHKQGFALENINSTNILLNDRGEVKLCGFSRVSKNRNNIPRPSDVWMYAATLIEFACGDQPSCYEKFHKINPGLRIFSIEEIELKEMSKNCFSMGYSHQPHKFFMECLKELFVSNFDALMKMDFYQQALKNIEENKVHLAKWVQAIIIAETRDTVSVQWFHKFMDPENAKIYDTSND